MNPLNGRLDYFPLFSSIQKLRYVRYIQISSAVVTETIKMKYVNDVIIVQEKLQ